MTVRRFAPPAVALLLAVLFGFAGGWAAQWIDLTGPSRDEAVREAILAHPEVIPEAIARLEAKERAKRLEPIRDQVLAPFPGAVMGNPDGSVTLVEFSDFACGFCRASVAEVDALIAANPDLKVVMRELPILSPQSADAARMALAAAEQGLYTDFHRAMFEAGRPSAKTIADAAAKAGLDMERARAFARSPRVEIEIARNLAMAEQLGFSGTPSWIVGEQAIAGAVGREALAKAIEAARGT